MLTLDDRIQVDRPLNVRAETLPLETDVPADARERLAKQLGDVLASTFVLYHKTQGFHWNVAGPLFYSVHKLTEEQYEDLAEAVDDIAERIRALGSPAPMGLAGYIEASVVKDQSHFPNAGEMLTTLSQDHRRVADQMRDVVNAAEALNDVYTADLLTARIGAHEEAAWMLTAIATQ